MSSNPRHKPQCQSRLTDHKPKRYDDDAYQHEYLPGLAEICQPAPTSSRLVIPSATDEVDRSAALPGLGEVYSSPAPTSSRLVVPSATDEVDRSAALPGLGEVYSSPAPTSSRLVVPSATDEVDRSAAGSKARSRYTASSKSAERSGRSRSPELRRPIDNQVHRRAHSSQRLFLPHPTELEENAHIIRWDLPNRTVTPGESPYLQEYERRKPLPVEHSTSRNSPEKWIGRHKQPDTASLDKIHPGGYLRGVCKLWMWYEGSDAASEGTGWLVEETCMVTAGHNVIEHAGREVLHLRKMEIWVGYHCANNQISTDTSPEYRYATRVALHAYHYEKSTTKQYDLALVQLDKPFADSGAFAYNDTPSSTWGTLDCPGYPGSDIKSNNNKDRINGVRKDHFREDGNALYMQPDEGKSDISVINDMIRHKLDTNHGSSGAPLIAKTVDGWYVLGVHTRVGAGDWNEAVVIGRRKNVNNLGNVIPAFVRALSLRERSRNCTFDKLPLLGNQKISDLWHVTIPLTAVGIVNPTLQKNLAKEISRGVLVPKPQTNYVRSLTVGGTHKKPVSGKSVKVQV